MEIGGFGPGHPYIRMLQRAEDRYCRTADRVVSILPKTVEHLAGRGLDPGRFRYLPNGVDAAASATSGDAPKGFDEWLGAARTAGRVCIGYAGGMVRQNAVATLLDAARALRSERFAFALFGDGHDADALRASAADLAHVRFFGRVPRAAALAALSRCDALWIGLAHRPLYRFGIGMNKIFDAMLTGRPVVASYTAGNDPIAEAGCGFTVAAEDPAALADALRRMAALGVADRDALGRRGGEFVRREHDYAAIAERFVETIREAQADPNPHRPTARSRASGT
jgi:glycosyltransferase involved in cell wall biosynthesis